MSNINKAAVLNPFTDLADDVFKYTPRATSTEYGVVALGSGIKIDALGRIYLDTQEYSDRLTAIEAQAASTLATQKSEVATAIEQVNLTQSQTITALTLEVSDLETNLTNSITATQTDLINRADQLAQAVTDTTEQLTQDNATLTQEIKGALDLAKRGISNQYDNSLTYGLGDRVVIDNGDIVKSTVANNTVNPNVDMTGWVKTNDASQIFDNSGMDLDFVNETIKTEINIATRLSKADFQKLKNLDRSLDISDYLNSILTEYSSKRTDADDTYSNAQGILKIILPKGVYEISKPIAGNGVYGLILEGAGVSTTSILYKKDTGDVFSFTPYLNVTFKNMSIIHQPISPVKSTWTNSLFKLNGFGGGRRFKTDHVLVVGFNKVFDFVSQGNVNEDTTHCMDSQFMHCNTFIYSRSSQAVNNSFGRCSWYGDIKKVFDVSNYGHTHIYDSGVVIAGAFFSLASHAGFYGKTAQFLMTNIKFEWLKSDLTNTNATTKIIETTDDPTISAYFKLTNCGIAGGSPDPSINSFDIRGGNMILDVDGGEWVGAKIATKAVTAGLIKDLGWIKFKGCAAAPLTSINRISGSSGAVHRPVIFENCTGTDNITLLGDSTVGNGAAVGYTTKNINNLTGNTGRLCTGVAVSTHSSSCYGQQVYVDKVQLLVKSSTSVTNAKAKLYFDSAKAVLIGEIPITAQPTPQIISFPATGFTNDGVYVEISQENANAVIIGHVRIESLSI